MLVKDPLTGQMRIEKRLAPVKYLETGKVKIGCAVSHEPSPMTDDAIRIQGALLGVHTHEYWSVPYRVYYLVLVVLLASLLVVSCQ